MIFDFVKKYLRVDTDTDDDQIKILIDAAKEYLTNAGVTALPDNYLYKLAIAMLVVNWYDNRCPVGQANEKMKYSLNAILNQLKWVGFDDE